MSVAFSVKTSDSIRTKSRRERRKNYEDKSLHSSEQRIRDGDKEVNAKTNEDLVSQIQSIPIKDERDSRSLVVEDVPKFLPLTCLDFLRRGFFSTRLLLGEGRFGKVFLGKENTSGSLVAIKVFKKATEFECAVRETRILAALSETGIVPKFFGLVDLSNVRFGWMRGHLNVGAVVQFVGDTMKQRTITLYSAITASRRQPVNVRNMLHWARLMQKLAVKLAKLHKLGLCFNDLHLKNIVLTGAIQQDPDVYLVDVGKVSFSNSQHAYRHYVIPRLRQLYKRRFPQHGPEIWEGQKFSTKSDVYSFGFILKCAKLGKLLGVTNLMEGCLAAVPRERPTMGEVVEKLNQRVRALEMMERIERFESQF
ncbi:high affinity nerve growth factor receptor [Lingula anatina]|uniref:High affinity nerve growth factor receptor n=1 Tax=Lingula anatina TaxID=7574 RepID=A0A1S3J7T4_LINAN|nr:high affinity nerve growth factor receptor [Lingula anatina]|eukprot:XP_013405919.1 high affinity nerve growth factor receptor [Lingula anatina]